MKNLYNFLLVTIICFASFPSIGQLNNQSQIEKGYIQTDKPMYRPGDDVWIKALIVNGANQPSLLSKIAHLEMIKPDGSQLFSKQIIIKDGSIADYFKIDNSTAGGIYQLKVKTAWMTEIDKSYDYTKEIIIQKYDPPKLLMKIELDKEAYGKGESVNASFDVKDLKDRPISHVAVEYTLFIDGIETQKLFPNTNNKGKSNAKFTLPMEINTSNVSINAKLSYRGQIESISKRVPIILENIDLQFLPEGGSLVEGYENVLAFKGLSETGKPADVAGEIVDGNGQKVLDFKSVHDGMGEVKFTPQIGGKYFAKLCSPYESSTFIPIEYQISNGTKISIIDQSEKYISVQVIGRYERGMRLALSNIYDEVWNKQINKKTKKNIIQIPIKKLLQGIHKISLQTNDKMVSERLLFLHPKKQMQVSMTLDKEKYGLREMVTATIKTTDHNGKPLSADLGIAVVEDKMLSFADDKQAHLTTELLLSSELKGDIHEPNYYFDSITVETNEHLDLVMLTNGWRSYLTHINSEDAFAHFVDQNSYIGQVLNQKNRKGIKAKVMVHENSQSQVKILETDEDGYFILPFYKDKQFNVYAKSENHKTLIRDISMIDLKKRKSKKYAAIKKEWSDVPKFQAVNDLTVLVEEILKDEEEKITYKEIEQFNVSLDEGALLDEIVISEYSVPLISIDNTTSGATITAEAIRSLPIKSINAIAATTSGLVVSNDGAINIRGSRSSSTMYYVDGVRVSGLIPQMMTNDENEDNIIFNRQHNKVFQFGSQTKMKKKRVLNTYKTSSVKQFYVPQYKKATTVVRDDFRQTIYWNPSVQTDAKGEAKVTFFTSDEVTSFSMVAEGITADGEVGRGLQKVVTGKPLNVDCKLPAYFVLGDTAHLSIVVNNDGDRDQNISISANASDLDTQLQEIQDAKLKKGESRVFLLTVIPTKEMSNATLNIRVKSDRELDIMSKKISVLNPYFPQQISFSGVDSDNFALQLHSPIANTVSAHFKIYDPVNSAMEGIESLLRRPSGCFEQVSSSTYPNVLVYQYLERDRNANNKSMKKAMKYIKQGYKKLAAYETTEDGFELYGRSPANMTLTAYGLLEFLDMSKVYNGVDEKMIKRTINYLLERRDGIGGFKNIGRRFGNADTYQFILNAYVLYALTSQNLVPVDLIEEYTAVKNHANETKDLYVTGLAALSAFNLGKTNDYELLTKRILKSIEQKDLKEITCNRTIMSSGTRDRNIETLSFCALALLKGNTSNRFEVQKIIDHILSSRHGGRFGSTQATCLATQAIIAYADSTPNIDPHGKEVIISPIIDDEIFTSIDNNIDLTDRIINNSHDIKVLYSAPSSKSYEMRVNYMSKIPPSVTNPELGLSTRLINNTCSIADQVSMEVLLTNNRNRMSANPTVILGIPSGMSIQMKQLKELNDAGTIAYFEIFNSRLVLYFDELAKHEKRKILIDLKAEIAGQFTAPSSCAYPYYDDRNTTWISGTKVMISRNAQPLNF